MAKNIFGSFFQKLIGSSVDQFATVESINTAIEKKQDKKIHADTYKSTVVHSRGNVFKYSRFDNLDKEIDTYLAK